MAGGRSGHKIYTSNVIGSKELAAIDKLAQRFPSLLQSALTPGTCSFDADDSRKDRFGLTFPVWESKRG